ncbi:MAG TPA: orotidine-5'-phosphate decarboxylase [Polyangiaceae bacterium]|nr:orotidine-5'-phosphate decarboxylase [Polyangiaceae bacterium]
MKPSTARERLAFALDYPDLGAARRGAALVSAAAGVLKIGLELFVREGPATLALGDELGAAIFLDLKLHDIPETVERAVASACELGARYLTVHASGGGKMLERAAKRAELENSGLVLLAVTVLTSLDEADLLAVGIGGTASGQVSRLAHLATSCGVPGLVCSAAEVGALRRELGSEVLLVTPGIRPKQAARGDDQKRVGTPGDAIRQGASILVVGRPIRDASDPSIAAEQILEEISEAERAGAP